MLVAGLLGSSSVVHSTLGNVVDKTSALINDICSYVKSRVYAFATAAGVPGDDDQFQNLLGDIDSVSKHYENLDTEYKRRKYFQNSDAFIHPEELPLGVGYFFRSVLDTFLPITVILLMCSS